MAKKVKEKKLQKQGKQKSKSKGLYWIAGIVLLVPLLLLGYIYLDAKESSGSPTVGNRFDNSLTNEITQEKIDQVKSGVTFSNADSVEVNLKSATLRITIDLKDKNTMDDVSDVIEKAYKKVDDMLPIKTYFTNQNEVKMYDLDIHVYNFIPEEGASTNGWAYKEKIKNASAKSAVTDTLSKAKNKEVSNKIEKEQPTNNK